jgi:c-di-GMP-binding flagellar brake protein YcgR
MENERRKNERIKKLLMVQYAAKTDRFLKWDMSTMKDLSEGGMLITTDRNFPGGTILKFRFKLPTDPFHKLTLKARVVCSANIVTKMGVVLNGYLLRVEFFELREEHKAMVRKYIQWFTSKRGGGK